ncbi:hypothetical protein D3C72_585120 [compost metagenome]
MMLGAIGLFDGDIKIAAVGGGVEVVDFKRTGGNVLLIDQITVLAHRHFGIGAGNTADNRGEPALAVGQHLFVRRDVNAAILQAVEYLALSAAFAARKLCFQGIKIVLHEGVNRVPAVVVVGFAPGGIVTHAPAAQVRAAAHIEVLIAGRVFVAVLILRAGKRVIRERHRHAIIPAGRGDVVSAISRNGGLRNAQMQRHGGKVERRRGLWNVFS